MHRPAEPLSLEFASIILMREPEVKAAAVRTDLSAVEVTHHIAAVQGLKFKLFGCSRHDVKALQVAALIAAMATTSLSALTNRRTYCFWVNWFRNPRRHTLMENSSFDVQPKSVLQPVKKVIS